VVGEDRDSGMVHLTPRPPQYITVIS